MALDNLTPVRTTTEALVISSPLVATWLSRALRLGDVIQDGPNAGWLFCKTKHGEPFLVEPQDSGVMRWRKAIAYATFVNATLPDNEQLDAMYEARDKGAFKKTFNTAGTYNECSYWSRQSYVAAYPTDKAEAFKNSIAHDMDFSQGVMFRSAKNFRSRVRLVRPYAVA